MEELKIKVFGRVICHFDLKKFGYLNNYISFTTQN